MRLIFTQLVFTLQVVTLAGLCLTACKRADEPGSHGAQQVDLITNNHPKLASILETYSSLNDWLVQAFDATSGGFTPVWDPTKPISGQPAEHEYPSNNSRRGIVAEGTTAFRISADQTGWDQLAGLIFELHNFRGAATFEQIHTAAVNREIDEPTYIRRNIEQEFTAVQATKEFLIENVLPLNRASDRSNRLLWALVRFADSVDEMLQRNERNGFDVEKHNEMLYETEVVPEMQIAPPSHDGRNQLRAPAGNRRWP